MHHQSNAPSSLFVVWVTLKSWPGLKCDIFFCTWRPICVCACMLYCVCVMVFADCAEEFRQCRKTMRWDRALQSGLHLTFVTHIQTYICNDISVTCVTLSHVGASAPRESKWWIFFNERAGVDHCCTKFSCTSLRWAILGKSNLSLSKKCVYLFPLFREMQCF